MQARSVFLASAVLLAGVSAAIGGVPQCDGISPVYNSSPDLVGELSTVRVASGLSNPLFVGAAPGDNERLFIVEKSGRIKILKDGAVQPTPFLDIQSVVNTGGSNERGLLGLAFHPEYETNGYFFVYYTSVSDGPVPSGALTVARYQRMTDDLANPASGEVVIFVPHPISNHNAGMIAFSPIDGHLYVGTGDGGSGCDPGPSPGNAQNLNSLLGKMLRLDVDSLPYSTAGNPFDGGTPGLDEIWMSGIRNPWRWSFDRENGAMYIGDVGQNAWEELDCLPPTSTGGENLGWVNYEGTHGCPNPSCGTQLPCPPADYHAPYRDYSLAGAPCAVVGGYVYRGCRMGDLQGTYFYSDACDDFVKTLRTNASCQVTPAPDLDRENDLEPGGTITISSIVSFGEDNEGEMYIVEHSGGEVFKIIPELFIMELSGPGATPLTFDAEGNLDWEDLTAASDVPTRFYRVYRADASVPGSGPAPFECVVRKGTATPSWNDSEDPLSGQVFYYLAVAENLSGDLTVPGAQSDGTLRVLVPGLCN